MTRPGPYTGMTYEACGACGRGDFLRVDLNFSAPPIPPWGDGTEHGPYPAQWQDDDQVLIDCPYCDTPLEDSHRIATAPTGDTELAGPGSETLDEYRRRRMIG